MKKSIAALGLMLMTFGTVETSSAAESVLHLCAKYRFTLQDGEWTGIYDGEFVHSPTSKATHTFVVIDTKADGSASVLYAVGAWPEWGIRPSCVRATGQFRDENTLKVQLRHGVTYYDFLGDLVTVRHTSESGTTRGQLTRSDHERTLRPERFLSDAQLAQLQAIEAQVKEGGRDAARTVQEQINDAGHGPVVVDGAYGKNTRKALIRCLEAGGCVQ